VSSLKPKLKKFVISTPGNLHGLSSNVSIFISSMVLEGRKNAGFFYQDTIEYSKMQIQRDY